MISSFTEVKVLVLYIALNLSNNGTCDGKVCCVVLQDNNQTALHLAVELDDDRTLYLVDFMVQNSNRCARAPVRLSRV